jgi:hypothetical protein
MPAITEKIVHESPCGMFRIVEQGNFFYPQERKFTHECWGRIPTMKIVEEVRGRSPMPVYESSWKNFYGGLQHERRYKSLNGAKKFIEACAEELQGRYILL